MWTVLHPSGFNRQQHYPNKTSKRTKQKSKINAINTRVECFACTDRGFSAEPTMKRCYADGSCTAVGQTTQSIKSNCCYFATATGAAAAAAAIIL